MSRVRGPDSTHIKYSQEISLDRGESRGRGVSAGKISLATNAIEKCSLPSAIGDDLGVVTVPGHSCTCVSVAEGGADIEEPTVTNSGKENVEQQVPSAEHDLEHMSTEDHASEVDAVRQSSAREELHQEQRPTDLRAQEVKALSKLWTVEETPEQDLFYTQKLSTFVEAFDLKGIILMMMPNRTPMKNMKDSVIAGQRFRELKNIAELEQHRTKEARADHLQTWQDMDDVDALMKVRSPGARNKQGVPFEWLASEIHWRREQASNALAAIDDRVQRAQDEATKAEMVWRKAMRLVDWEHQRLFRDAGTIDCKVEHWEEEDCVSRDRVHPVVPNIGEHTLYDNVPLEGSRQRFPAPHNQEPLRSTDKSFCKSSNGNFITEERVPPKVTDPASRNIDTGANLRQAYNDLWKSYRDRVARCEKTASDARFAHDEHRNRYYELMSQCAADHPELEGDELFQAFNPVYLHEGQKRIRT